VFENPFYGADGVLKRICDVCLAGALLMLAAIPMLIIGALVKCTSPGPVFLPPKALRTRRPRDSRLQVPFHARL